jgi:hypothetical protein
MDGLKEAAVKDGSTWQEHWGPKQLFAIKITNV